MRKREMSKMAAFLWYTIRKSSECIFSQNDIVFSSAKQRVVKISVAAARIVLYVTHCCVYD